MKPRGARTETTRRTTTNNPTTELASRVAIGAKRIAPLWRLLDGLAETDWTDATDMDGAQVAVADYRPD